MNCVSLALIGAWITVLGDLLSAIAISQETACKSDDTKRNNERAELMQELGDLRRQEQILREKILELENRI